MFTKDDLMRHLKLESKVFSDPRVESAFTHIDRADFVHADYEPEAYEDYALPIGFGQTISQPTTVAFMLELLEVEPGQKVLDVGSGSGYTTALLSHIVGEKGLVVGVEKVEQLVGAGRANIKKYEFPRTHIEKAEKKIGYPHQAPYDRILVSADADTVPEELVEELALGGILVIPVGGTMYKLQKTEEGMEEIAQFPGFSFVPLV